MWGEKTLLYYHSRIYRGIFAEILFCQNLHSLELLKIIADNLRAYKFILHKEAQN